MGFIIFTDELYLSAFYKIIDFINTEFEEKLKTLKIKVSLAY